MCVHTPPGIHTTRLMLLLPQTTCNISVSVELQNFSFYVVETPQIQKCLFQEIHSLFYIVKCLMKDTDKIKLLLNNIKSVISTL